MKIVRENPISVALVDLHLNSEDGIQTTEKLREVDNNLEAIIITGFPSYDSATLAMKTGAFDYISKGTPNDAILQCINKAIQKRHLALGEVPDNLPEEKSFKLVLICRNTQTIEKIETFCTNSRDFRFISHIHTFEKLQSGSPDQADIALIGEPCIRDRLTDALQVVQGLEQNLLGAKPVVLGETLTYEEQVQLLKSGIKGFVSPDWDVHKLEHALNLILEGEIWASRKAISESLQDFIGQQKTALPAAQGHKLLVFRLTNREKEILATMVKGMGNKEIAEVLHISETTVKTHIHRIFKKMKVKNRTQAILKAMDEIQ